MFFTGKSIATPFPSADWILVKWDIEAGRNKDRGRFRVSIAEEMIRDPDVWMNKSPTLEVLDRKRSEEVGSG